MKKYFFSIIPLGIIFLLVIYLFGNTLLPPKGKIIYGEGDIAGNYYFRFNYFAQSIKTGTIPFWNPYNFSGTPFLANPEITGFYPPFWLFFLLPLNQSFSIYFFIHIVFAAVSMYWLLRQYTNKWGAFAGASIFALGGYFVARVYLGHPKFIDAAAWVPLAFGITRKALIEPSYKNIIISALVFFMLLLVGNELFLLFIIESIFLYFIYLLLTDKRIRQLNNIFIAVRTIIIQLLLALGLAAIAILPRFEFLFLSLRYQGFPYPTASLGSMPFEGLILFVDPFHWGLPFWDNYTYWGPWPGHGEFNYYVGTLPILLIFSFLLLTLISKIIRKIKLPKINSDIWFYLFIVIPIFLIISFGIYMKPNFHEILWQFTPFYKKIRLPARHLFMVYFSLSIVSGLIIGWLKNNIVRVVLIILILVDLLSFSKQFMRLSDIPEATFDQKLISILKADTSVYRLLPDFTVVSPVRRDLEFDAATMYHIFSTSEYEAMVLWRYYHFIDLLNKSPISSIQYRNVEIPPPNPNSSYIDFLNVKYILSDKNFDAVDRGNKNKFKLLLDGQNYRLYQNLSNLPRFFLVGNASVYDSNQSLEDALRSDADLSKTVLFKKSDIGDISRFKLDCSNNSKGAVEIVEYRENKISLRISSDCNTFLSTSEVYYPGWKAKIDSLETKIYPSNSSFRSIFIPKGNHSVEFYYFPEVYYIGLSISVISLLVLIIFIYINKRKIVSR